MLNRGVPPASSALRPLGSPAPPRLRGSAAGVRQGGRADAPEWMESGTPVTQTRANKGSPARERWTGIEISKRSKVNFQAHENGFPSAWKNHCGRREKSRRPQRIHHAVPGWIPPLRLMPHPVTAPGAPCRAGAEKAGRAPTKKRRHRKSAVAPSIVSICGRRTPQSPRPPDALPHPATAERRNPAHAPRGGDRKTPTTQYYITRATRARWTAEFRKIREAEKSGRGGAEVRAGPRRPRWRARRWRWPLPSGRAARRRWR